MESITKLCNYQIKMRNALTTLNTKIKDMYNEGSDLTDSYYDDG